MIRSSVDLPSPLEFGAPPRFANWRHEQADAVTRILRSSKRFTAINAPTGIGKTMIAVMTQRLSGWRVLVLTSTRALQDQYDDHWSPLTFDMRGQQNYECSAVRSDGPLARYHRGGAAVMVDRAPCHAGVWCGLRHRGGCEYFDDQRTAADAPLVVTNYAYWLASGAALGHFDCVILDEADEADAEVRRALHMNLHHPQIRNLLGMDVPDTDSASVWRDWAAAATRAAADAVTALTDEMQREDDIDTYTVAELRKLKDLQSTLGRIRKLAGEWLIAPSRRASATDFDPVWPTPYIEEMLFRDIERVVLMSATLTPKDLQILGVPPNDSEYIEYDSPFAVSNRPVYIIDFGEGARVRVDSKLRDSGYAWLVALMDSAIAQRVDRKLLIQAVSYRLMQEILHRSRYRHLMVSHTSSDDKPSALAAFRKATPGGKGSILNSPGVKVGESFPMDECETVLIPKIPFLDMRDPIMRRRESEDAEYGGWLMMKALAQSVGRHVRSVDDRGETLIFDDHARWAIPAYRKHAPRAFMKALNWVHELPKPLAKL